MLLLFPLLLCSYLLFGGAGGYSHRHWVFSPRRAWSRVTIRMFLRGSTLFLAFLLPVTTNIVAIYRQVVVSIPRLPVILSLSHLSSRRSLLHSILFYIALFLARATCYIFGFWFFFFPPYFVSLEPRVRTLFTCCCNRAYI